MNYGDLFNKNLCVYMDEIQRTWLKNLNYELLVLNLNK
jgi:hypothetical protein